MKKLKKIWRLSDPYPNLWYEISCYLKSILSFILTILGFFFLFSPSLKRDLTIFGFAVILGPLGRMILAWEVRTFGQNFTVLSLTLGGLLIVSGLWVFWQVKLVRKLFKTLTS